MNTVYCGVCTEQPSKYRCPGCDLRYCSLPCYKLHKSDHHPAAAAAADALPGPPPPPRPDQLLAPTPRPLPDSSARRHLPGRKPAVDFSGLERDGLLTGLLSKDPTLRVKLQSVFGYTLEPPPPPSYQATYRGGTGGSYGAGGGGMGYGGSSSWTQAKGDAEALERLRRLREEDEEGSVAEFVRLVEMRFGGDGGAGKGRGG